MGKKCTFSPFRQRRFVMESNIKIIGEGLYRFQSAINENGINLEDYIKEHYLNKWISDELYHVSAIRTSMIGAATRFLVNEGLLNLERVMLSIITDPLAHDIEHTPSIKYKGHTYLTTRGKIGVALVLYRRGMLDIVGKGVGDD